MNLHCCENLTHSSPCLNIYSLSTSALLGRTEVTCSQAMRRDKLGRSRPFAVLERLYHTPCLWWVDVVRIVCGFENDHSCLLHVPCVQIRSPHETPVHLNSNTQLCLLLPCVFPLISQRAEPVMRVEGVGCPARAPHGVTAQKTTTWKNVECNSVGCEEGNPPT
jgi:hypothetical protein